MIKLPEIDQKIAVSVVLVSTMFMAVMDITVVNVALPSIGRDLNTAPTSVSIVSIAYLVALAVVIPASGWLGDRFGHRRILLVAIVLFAIGSAACGLSQTFEQLIAARVLQGVGGGILTPVGMALLLRTFPLNERVRVARILLLPTALAPATGPALGGVLVNSLSWRWVFFINLPIALAAVLFGIFFLRDQDTDPAGAFDKVGFALSGLGFAALMYGISEGPERGWNNRWVIFAIIVGALLLTTLVFHQLRVPEPLLRLHLYGNHLFRSASGVMFLTTAAFQGTLLLVTLMLQDGLGVSALDSGLTTFPEALGVIVGSQIVSRRLYGLIGPSRLMAFGLTAIACASIAMTTIHSTGQLWWLRGLMFVMGYGLAHVMVSSQAATMAQISRADTSRASSLFSASRQLGGAIGVAVLTTTLTIVGVNHTVQSHSVANLSSYHIALIVSAIMALIGATIALQIRDRDAADSRPAPRSERDQTAAERRPQSTGLEPPSRLTAEPVT